MSYQFAGFFTRPAVPLREFPADAVAIQIGAPFLGTGIRFHSLIGKTPAVADVLDLASKIGVAAAPQWIYLTYDCWGGEIDFVYGFTSTDGVLSPPVEDSSWDSVEATYYILMSRFGIGEESARDFAPFTRGFWGEND